MKVCLAGPFHIASVLDFFSKSDKERLRSLPGMGGYCMTELSIARRKMGLSTTVVSLDPAATRLERFKGDGIEYIVCPCRKKGLLRDAYAIERRHLVEAIRESCPDIVHAHWSYEYALGSLDSGLPSLVTARDHPLTMLKYLDARFSLAFLYALLVFKRGKFFTAVSPSVARFVESVRRQNVPVIANMYPVCIKENRSINKGSVLGTKPYRIVSLLNGAPFKNVFRALEAFATVRRQERDTEYILAGPGLGPSEHLARRAKERAMADGARFVGRITHQEAISLLAQCDVLFHPSLQEACPNPVLEGFALGRPVIVARNWKDAQWVVRDCALLADGKNPADMAAKIVSLIASPQDARKLGAKGQIMAEERFAPEKIVAQYENEYEKVLSQSRR